MKTHLLKYLSCPICRGNFKIEKKFMEYNEIKEGKLECINCKKEYKISNFIPRFINTDKYVDSFSFEWKKHTKTQLDSANRTKQSEEAFKEKTGLNSSEFKDKLVLDAGCGMGRFSEIVLKYGGEVVGVDLSYSIESAFDNLGLNPKAHFIQADILNLPFKEEIFDSVFSIGVLHHTPNTKKAFLKLIPFLKKDGEIAIWVYARSAFSSMISDFYRLFSVKIPKNILYKLTRIFVPYIYYFHKRGKLWRYLIPIPISLHSDPEWRILDTFDWYSPKYQWKFTYNEVKKWFEKAGLKGITQLGFPVGIRAKKP